MYGTIINSANERTGNGRSPFDDDLDMIDDDDLLDDDDDDYLDIPDAEEIREQMYDYQRLK